MSEVSAVLNQLIDVAERTLLVRVRLAPDGFETDLAAEAIALQPPVGVALSDAPGLLAKALLSLWNAREDDRPLWMGAIAMLLLIVRKDLGKVIAARQQPVERERAVR